MRNKKKKSFGEIYPVLAQMWHPKLNGKLTPYDLAAGSGRIVWLRCEKGHEWNSSLSNFVRDKTCPYCTGSRAIPGETDIKTTHSEVMKLWDRKKNEEKRIYPENIKAASHKRAYWKCEKGHSWNAIVNDVCSNGSRCPYCSGRKAIPGETDIKTIHPEIMHLWDYEKNEDEGIYPDDIMPKSVKWIWWKCEKGHSWKGIPANVIKGHECPYCSGRKAIPGETDIKTTHPEIMHLWDYERNEAEGITPENTKAKAFKRIWWKCEKGHSWQTSPNTLSKGCGCPYCAGKKAIPGETDFETIHSELMYLWDYEKNNAEEIYPHKTLPNSRKKVWLICERGHSWKSSPNILSKGCRCPYCAGNKAIPGETDLKTLMPDIAAEWNYEKNRNKTPEQFTKGSSQKVWWICSEGHE